MCECRHSRRSRLRVHERKLSEAWIRSCRIRFVAQDLHLLAVTLDSDLVLSIVKNEERISLVALLDHDLAGLDFCTLHDIVNLLGLRVWQMLEQEVTLERGFDALNLVLGLLDDFHLPWSVVILLLCVVDHAHLFLLLGREPTAE